MSVWTFLDIFGHPVTQRKCADPTNYTSLTESGWNSLILYLSIFLSGIRVFLEASRLEIDVVSLHSVTSVSFSPFLFSSLSLFFSFNFSLSKIFCKHTVLFHRWHADEAKTPKVFMAAQGVWRPSFLSFLPFFSYPSICADLKQHVLWTFPLLFFE